MTERPACTSSASRALAAKLAALIVIAALTAAAMLSMRQQRLQAAHELARAHLRARSHERIVERLQAEIAARVAPHRLEQLAERASLRPAVEGVGAVNEEEAPLARLVWTPRLASPAGAPQ